MPIKYFSHLNFSYKETRFIWPFEDLKLGIFVTKLGSEKSKSFDKIHT